MLVIMTRDQRGSPNGIAVNEYKKDQEYDIPKDLAKIFIKDLGCAVKVKEKSENKALNSAPENASMSNESIIDKPYVSTFNKPNKRGRRK